MQSIILCRSPCLNLESNLAVQIHWETLKIRFNSEYLHSLRPNGFPPHMLNLKPGIPLMLLRNINPRQGLCNGTRLIFDKCLDNKLLQCRIAESGHVVLIPRISLWMAKKAIPSENLFCYFHKQIPTANSKVCWCMVARSSLYSWSVICCLLKSEFSIKSMVCTSANTWAKKFHSIKHCVQRNSSLSHS